MTSCPAAPCAAQHISQVAEHTAHCKAVMPRWARTLQVPNGSTPSPQTSPISTTSRLQTSSQHCKSSACSLHKHHEHSRLTPDSNDHRSGHQAQSTKRTAPHAAGAAKPSLWSKEVTAKQTRPRVRSVALAHPQAAQTGVDETCLAQILHSSLSPQQRRCLELMHAAKQAVSRRTAGKAQLFTRLLAASLYGGKTGELASHGGFYFMVFFRGDNCHWEQLRCRCNKSLTRGCSSTQRGRGERCDGLIPALLPGWRLGRQIPLSQGFISWEWLSNEIYTI